MEIIYTYIDISSLKSSANKLETIYITNGTFGFKL